MPEGSSIINTASVNADAPSPHLLAYATTTNGRFRTSQAGSLSFWRRRASGQLRRARAGLDPLNSFNNAGRDCHALRRTGSNETTGAAARARIHLCHARIGRGELCLWRDGFRSRANPLSSALTS